MVEGGPPTRDGWACVQYTINAEGRVESVEIAAASDKQYGAWAAAAQGSLLYKPALKNGRPVPFRSMMVLATGRFSAFPTGDVGPNRSLLPDGAPTF